MTLFDLRGKEIYSGSQKIASAYLGNDSIFSSPSGAVPPEAVTFGSYQAAYDFTSRAVLRYLTSPSSNSYFNLTVPAEALPNEFQRKGLVVKSGSGLTLSPTPSTNVVNISVTWNNNHASPTDPSGVIFSRRPSNDAYFELSYSYDAASGKTKYKLDYRGGGYTNFIAIPEVDTKHIEVTIVADGGIYKWQSTKYVYSGQIFKIYVNGISVLSSTSQTFYSVVPSAAANIIIGPGRASGSTDNLILYDVKTYLGSAGFSPSNVTANYQNVQERLQNI